MPNRILREGILTSPRVKRLEGWASEVFYRRLMSVVDDFGRYHADHGLLRAACYPRQLNKVSDADIGKWLADCESAALVSMYPASDGERYLQLLDFRQQARATKSKFPEPLRECAANATQVMNFGAAPAPVFEDGGGDVSEGGGEAPAAPARKRASSWTPPDWVPAEPWANFVTHRKAMRGVPFTDAARDGVLRDLAKFMAAGHDPGELLATAVTRGWRTVFEPKPRAGLNGQQKSFRERDAEIAAARVHEMTGGLMGKPLPDERTVDMEAPNVKRIA